MGNHKTSEVAETAEAVDRCLFVTVRFRLQRGSAPGDFFNGAETWEEVRAMAAVFARYEICSRQGYDGGGANPHGFTGVSGTLVTVELQAVGEPEAAMAEERAVARREEEAELLDLRATVLSYCRDNEAPSTAIDRLARERREARIQAHTARAEAVKAVAEASEVMGVLGNYALDGDSPPETLRRLVSERDQATRALAAVREAIAS
jgi:hypothetical protein